MQQGAWTEDLFDHLIGAGQERTRYLDSERLGRPEVDHELNLGLLGDWQIGRPGASKNLGGIDADLTVTIGKAGAVADEAPRGDELAEKIHRRQRVARRKRHEP